MMGIHIYYYREYLLFINNNYYNLQLTIIVTVIFVHAIGSSLYV